MGVIQDALNQNTAAVGDDRRLHTQTVAIDEATRASLETGEYFILCNGTGGGHSSVVNGHILWMKNTSISQNCLIQSISVSSGGSGFWHVAKGGTVSNYDVTATAVNFNLSSSKTAPVEAFKATTTSGGMTITGTSMIFGGHVTANAKWVEPLNGSLVLGTNNSIGMLWYGDSTVAIGIQFYMKDKT